MLHSMKINANSGIFRSLLYPSLWLLIAIWVDPWQFIGKSLPFTKLPNPSKEAAPFGREAGGGSLDNNL